MNARLLSLFLFCSIPYTLLAQNNPLVPDPPVEKPEPKSIAEARHHKSILPGLIVSTTDATPVSPHAPFVNTAPALLNSAEDLSPEESTMLFQLNAFRHRCGLGPLTITANLMARARKHAAWMAGNNSMTHSAGIQENIAAGQRTPVEVTNVWINSGGHNVNMRTSAKECGVAMVQAKNGVRYWCQQFANNSESWNKPKEKVKVADYITNPTDIKPPATTITPPADIQNNNSTTPNNYYRRGLFRR